MAGKEGGNGGERAREGGREQGGRELARTGGKVREREEGGREGRVVGQA